MVEVEPLCGGSAPGVSAGPQCAPSPRDQAWGGSHPPQDLASHSAYHILTRPSGGTSGSKSKLGRGGSG